MPTLHLTPRETERSLNLYQQGILVRKEILTNSTLENVGWEVQVVGRESNPEEIRKIGFVGLLLTC